MEHKTKYLLIAIVVFGLLTVIYLLAGFTLPPIFQVLAGDMLNSIGGAGGQNPVSALVNAITFAIVASMTWAMYFLPALLAFQSKHPKASVIFWVDLCTGWTLIGWFVAFFWVMRGDADAPPDDEGKNAEV
ncbi:hypothetical protein AGMMS49545_07210 [Betaproteobacteria bacterium]|nr:hypothetical protein AGMMS49545_07210 [Betaproteobacteria bacterium]GHU46571.1 hypothetical protein AGMMS50289_20280 [Betaproteobacteria bacterium]